MLPASALPHLENYCSAHVDPDKVDFAQNQLDHVKSVIIQQSVAYSHFLELYKNSETTEVFLYIINRCLLC
jgi:hypothetical protein